MHRLLKRQLRKHLDITGEPPASLRQLLGAIDRTYAAYDDDRRLLERSLELSSAEMRALNEDLQARRDELEANLGQVKAMQEQLIMKEKMAELGTLTAGIAHEIKNPLNFVNNFSTLSIELLEELIALIEPCRDAVAPDVAEEIAEVVGMLSGNLRKIHDHGVRADRIVRSMLMHSRGRAGEFSPTDINKLLEEYANLSFHGARALDSDFNVTFDMALEPALGQVWVVRSDIARVFLNIINNACYATAARRRREGQRFAPVVRVVTRALDDERVEVRIRDNGDGIPPEHLDRLFTPFFTTKPAGEGTGLGLSIAHDIVSGVHRGTLTVRSRVGEYAEFTITLPRRRA